VHQVVTREGRIERARLTASVPHDRAKLRVSMPVPQGVKVIENLSELLL
jgi:hypothetical protein